MAGEGGRYLDEDENDLFNEAEYGRNTRSTRRDPSEVDSTLADIPLLGWLSGSTARRDAANNHNESLRNREYWDQLTDYMPSADDLSVDYASEDYVPGGESRWATESEADQRGTRGIGDALEHMTEWARGGFTDADRSMMDETRRTEDIRSRGDREAALSAMEARGMSGSGMGLMARMGADEAGAARTSAMNATMMGAAQQRQMDAARAMGSLGSTLSESDDRRASALDAWNAREADYGRGLENRNTDRENRGRESRSTANQSAYENRERAVAGATNQYSTDASGRRADAAREDDRNAGLFDALGELL